MIHVHLTERAILEFTLIEYHIIQANIESGILIRYIEFVILENNRLIRSNQNTIFHHLLHCRLIQLTASTWQCSAISINMDNQIIIQFGLS